MKKKSIITLFIYVLVAYSLDAQNESIRIENFFYKDGLKTSGVNSVYKDSKGFLWLCTKNGLFRHDGYSFKNINAIASGNLKYETYSILQDKYDNFWIGTAGKGVVYYNTRSGRVFNLKLSQGNNSKVNQIFFFQEKIWLSTDKGLLVIDNIKDVDSSTVLDTKVFLPEPSSKGLQMNVINFVYAKPDSKTLWVGTNSSLYELNTDTYKFSIIRSNNQESIRWISDYNGEKIIVSSWDGGVFLVNLKTHLLENDPFVNEMNKIVGDKRVKSAQLDSQNRCWVATFGEGLYIFEQDVNGKIKFENYRDNDNKALKLKSNFIDQIFFDGSGIAWISMAESGLSKIYYRKTNFQHFNFVDAHDKSGLKEIHDIKQSSDNEKFWVSFNRNEIDLFNSRDYSYRQFTNSSRGLKLQNDKIKSTYQDKKGNLWIVYSRIGIYVVPAKYTNDLINGKLEGILSPVDANNLFSRDPRSNSYITTFYEDSKGRLWVGGWGDCYVFILPDELLVSKTSNRVILNTKVNQIFTEEKQDQYKFTISPVSAIVEVSKNHFWIGTRNNGIIDIEETADFKFVGTELNLNDRLPSNYIKCFYKGKDNSLWIGTNAGMCCLRNNKFHIINVNNGLSSESISSLAEDKNGDIWISTFYGISKIDHQDFSVINFLSPKSEKLNQFIDGSVAVTSNGYIWFSTSETLVGFNADSIANLKISAPIYFTDIKINNQPIKPFEKYRGVRIIRNEVNTSKVINVPYGSSLNIEFAALDYLNPEKILYKYRIGNSSEWIVLNPGQRSLNLPNMNSGEYNLSIMVANSSDNLEQRSIKINYLPPFWLSKIAYVIYIVVVLSILLTYRKLLIQKTFQKLLIEKERYERKKIEELDKMKSEFFSNISHEFRTPLSLIINPLEKLLNEGKLQNKDKDRVNLILKSSNRLLKLTNELMDFSKLEKELLKPDFQTHEMVSFTNDICQLFNNLADNMNIEFRTIYSFERLEMPIDKGMVEKIIFNLLSNAFKYTPLNGMIMVNVSKYYETETEYLKISVVNTGEGISEENINRVFDRFYQVNNVQNKNITGTGIGLSLVKNFVELHNGKVEVKSEPNLETCFDVFLPTTQPNYHKSVQIPAVSTKKAFKEYKPDKANESASASKNMNHYRVLVIEDEDDIRNYIVEELSLEYRVISAQNGEEGLNIANEIIPDLIITDVMMPVLSGIELCKRLKTQVITSHIPIIILSAKTSINQQIEGLEMGADVYIIKPFSIDFLKIQVQRLITFKQTVYSKFLKETTLIPQDSVTNKLDDDFMQKVLAFIEENITNSELNVDQIANCVSLSKVQTYRKVKAITGLSIVEFIRTVRLKKASQLILEGSLNFSEIAFDTGFSTPSYFSKCFHDHFGKTPSEFASEFGNKKSAAS